MKEEWIDVIGYEGLYQVSNLGQVKSLNYKRTGKAALLSPTISKGKYVNYYKVILSKELKLKTIKVHQLVAMAFLGYKRDGKNLTEVVDHIDGDSLNNNLNNLQIITQKENVNKGKIINRIKNEDYGLYKTYNNKLRIVFRVGKKIKSFGTFSDLDEARLVRDEALKKEGLR